MATGSSEVEKTPPLPKRRTERESSCSRPRRSRSRSSSRSRIERLRRKYHKMALKNKLKPITEETVDEREASFCLKRGRKPDRHKAVDQAKKKIIAELLRSDGNVATEGVQNAISQLVANSDPSSFCPRKLAARPDMWGTVELQLEDTWISLNKPEYKDCLGKNENNDCMYTLGRMTFGMLQPTQLVCSIQGTFNEIGIVNGMDEEAVKHVPSNLKCTVRDGNVQVRSYSIVTAFTIEPYDPSFGEDSPNKGVTEPIEALMTVNSFIIPYPKKNRFSVWFTGGFVEVNGGAEKWHSMFSRDSTPKRTLGERAMLFAAGLLMGATANDEMDENGRLSFELTRPAAGNIDLLYMDEILRVMRTSKGTTYVFARANPQDYSSSDESNTSYTSRESSSSLENSSKSLNLDGTNAPSRPLRHSSPPRNGNGTPRHPVRCPSPPRNQNAPPRRPGRSRSPVLHVPETYMPEEDLCDSGSRWTDSTSGAPKCTNHEAPSPVERTPTGHKGDGNGRWTGTDSFAPRPPSRHTSPKGKAPSTAGAPRRPSRQISPRRKVSTSTVILQLPSRSISPATRDTEEEGIPFIFPLDASPKTTR